MAMYTKACICNNVTMQIQVKENKVALEVAHLQELLNHWAMPLALFLESKQNLHPEGMPNLGKFLRDSGGITQDNHVPRKGLRPEWLKEVMNPVPVILSMFVKP